MRRQVHPVTPLSPPIALESHSTRTWPARLESIHGAEKNDFSLVFSSETILGENMVFFRDLRQPATANTLPTVAYQTEAIDKCFISNF